MEKYLNKIMFMWRMKSGLLWRSVRPSACDFDGLANWLLGILCVAATLGMYGLLDYQEQETEKRIAQAQAHILMGGVITDKAQTVAVKCAQVMDVVR